MLHLHAFGQSFYLRGGVKDEAGKPLQNVTIIHSTGHVSYTGAEGLFGIVSDNPVDTLVFHLSGYIRQPAAVRSGEHNNIVLKRSAEKINSHVLSSFTGHIKKQFRPQWLSGNESYASIVENRFISSAENSRSSLSLNIDRAAYSNIRRLINSKMFVPPDAVRIDEMLNYFNFSYQPPENGQDFEMQGALTTCPWNPNSRLLFTTIHSRQLEISRVPATHLVFLIDISGSMEMPNRLPLLKSAFRGLVNNLRAKDSVSIVVYGGMTGVVLDATSGADKQAIFNAIDSLEPSGSTPGESGIRLAYSVAQNHFIKNGNNRVIMATDGDFNVGIKEESELEEMITSQKNAGVYLTCLGVGMGNYKDSKIQVLAQKGNGNFAYLDTYAEAEKVLMKEFMLTVYSVADGAYLDVDFDPAFVKEYRLIGFDNKLGALRDTSSGLDGGEIGSANSTMVAFEIVPTDPAAVNLPVKFNLNYYSPDSSSKNVFHKEMQLTTQPLTAIDRNYGFATSVILFGSLLRGSPFVKENLWNDVGLLAAKYADPNDPLQKEFVVLTQQAKAMYYSKKKKRG